MQANEKYRQPASGLIYRLDLDKVTAKAHHEKHGSTNHFKGDYYSHGHAGLEPIYKISKLRPASRGFFNSKGVDMNTVENLSSDELAAEVQALEEEFLEHQLTTPLGIMAVKRHATVFREDETYYSD
jgi:hypothetical protein